MLSRQGFLLTLVLLLSSNSAMGVEWTAPDTLEHDFPLVNDIPYMELAAFTLDRSLNWHAVYWRAEFTDTDPLGMITSIIYVNSLGDSLAVTKDTGWCSSCD